MGKSKFYARPIYDFEEDTDPLSKCVEEEVMYAFFQRKESEDELPEDLSEYRKLWDSTKSARRASDFEKKVTLARTYKSGVRRGWMPTLVIGYDGIGQRCMFRTVQINDSDGSDVVVWLNPQHLYNDVETWRPRYLPTLNVPGKALLSAKLQGES